MATEQQDQQQQPRGKCLVCGAVAGKHNYYGARTCISCRGFFRRSVQSKQHLSFACMKTSASLENPTASRATSTASTVKCQLDSKSRKSCKKCRFDKCLKVSVIIMILLQSHNFLSQVGMKTAYVLTEEERCLRMLQRSKMKALADPKSAVSLTFTSEEREHAERLYGISIEIFSR